MGNIHPCTVTGAPACFPNLVSVVFADHIVAVGYAIQAARKI
jgi:hypothetical protein